MADVPDGIAPDETTNRNDRSDVQTSETAAARTPEAMRLLLALGVSCLAFWATWVSFLDVWSAQPYTHGYFVAAVCAWLVWRNRASLRHAEAPWLPAVAVGAGISIVWMLASVVSARMVAQATLPLLLLAWTGATFGRSSVRAFAPVAALFYLAVPFWGVFNRSLQSLTVVMSGGLVDLLGVPAVIRGDFIEITYGSFLVEGGCAGLNYLLAALTIGAIYSLIVPMRWPTALAVVGAFGGLSIIGNWIRVAGLVYLGHTTEMQTIFIRSDAAHLGFGWGIFVVALAILFPVAEKLVRRGQRRRKRPVVDASAPSRSARLPSFRTASTASAAIVVGPLAMLTVGALPEADVSPPNVSGRVLGWGTSERPYEWYPAFSGPDERLAYRWAEGADTVMVDRLVYREQEQGAELIGYDSRVAADSVIAGSRTVVVPGPPLRLLNEAIVRDENSPLLIWYWYRVGGIETQSSVRAKLLEVVAFFRRRTVSELLAISTRCAPTDCSEASRRLTAFLDAR